MQKTVLITGGNGGIGQATATEMARRGYRVIITARSQAKAEAALAEITAASGSDDVEFRLLDLASLDSVRALVAQLHDDLDGLDVLIDNAGIVQRTRTETADGFESTFGVNHLGHFVLTNGLVDLLEAAAPSRIVVLSSGAHEFAKGGLDFEDLQAERSFSSMRVYGRSKLANLLFTRELAKRLDGTGVTVNAVHPGAVRTRLGRDGDGGRLGNLAMALLGPFFRSADKGARTSVYVATDPSLADVSGAYFANEKTKEPAATALDDEAAARLWTISEELTGATR
ncbi:MAG: SDR family oxidoreductase [Acidimicrobiia bacterium]|nr:SDR family oxidoreductase [Acidimicrobiia bacterium]MDH5237458.1 SDR family oxidoreductase [Acidimicrobiia bacterium]